MIWSSSNLIGMYSGYVNCFGFICLAIINPSKDDGIYRNLLDCQAKLEAIVKNFLLPYSIF